MQNADFVHWQKMIWISGSDVWPGRCRHHCLDRDGQMIHIWRTEQKGQGAFSCPADWRRQRALKLSSRHSWLDLHVTLEKKSWWRCCVIVVLSIHLFTSQWGPSRWKTSLSASLLRSNNSLLTFTHFLLNVVLGWTGISLGLILFLDLAPKSRAPCTVSFDYNASAKGTKVVIESLFLLSNE